MKPLFALLFAFLTSIPAEPVLAQTLPRDERWMADLDALKGKIMAVHPNPYTRTSREEFEKEIRSLREHIPRLTDAEVVVGFARIMALLNDSHSALSLTQAGTSVRRYPLGFRWFTDGLYVTAAPETGARLVGARVRAMNGRRLEEIYEALRPWVSYDTESWYRHLSQTAMATADLLRAAGVLGPDLKLDLEAERPDGEVFVESIPLSAGTLVEGPLQAQPSPPYYRRYPSLDYWFDYLEESRTLYIQYNRCRNNPLLPISVFAEEIIAFAEAHQPARWVIDVRENTGGASVWFQQMLLRLSEAVKEGRIPYPAEGAFGLIGKKTFSSGVLAAHEMRRAGVTLAGETTGGRMGWFGETIPFYLPYSGLAVTISTRIVGDPATGNAIEPELQVDFPAQAYFANKDPFLETVLSLRQSVTAPRRPETHEGVHRPQDRSRADLAASSGL